ncbi:MAG: hypothetical protein MJ162_03185 [Treponema sp.]|nr:hypothetical protein [Treponema sp.]
MAGTSEEINVINHLIKIEKDAYTLIDEAVQDSEARLSSARTLANSEYKAQYDACVQGLDKEYHEKLEKMQADHDFLISEYKSNLTNHKQNKEAFNELLDSLLFASK